MGAGQMRDVGFFEQEVVMQAVNENGLDQVVMNAAHVVDGPPAQILISPWGRVESTAGSFLFDEQAAAATIEAFVAHGVDLPIDYEHQTLGGQYSAPDGLAPAAGWIKALRAVSPEQAKDNQTPGLWAEVVWTPEASEKLVDRKYRYISPVALVRRSDSRVIGLHSAALTNKPAIVGMRPVVNSGDGSDRLRELLALDEHATEDVILVAAAERIVGLEKLEAQREADGRVARALSAGKLGAAQKEWATALALRDPSEFDRWESTAPVMVPLGRVNPGRVSQEGQGRQSAARAEFAAHREFLEKLCSEEAYVAHAI
jgi:phage I-like protein